jgi:hypothetical protein
MERCPRILLTEDPQMAVDEPRSQLTSKFLAQNLSTGEMGRHDQKQEGSSHSVSTGNPIKVTFAPTSPPSHTTSTINAPAVSEPDIKISQDCVTGQESVRKRKAATDQEARDDGRSLKATRKPVINIGDVSGRYRCTYAGCTVASFPAASQLE